jgi:hypothetical protein
MSSISQSSAAKKLIQAFSEISSTEDFIIYVAGTDNMLAFCRELLEQYDRDNLALMTLEVNSLCAAQGILPNLLYSEIRKVLIALNRFHDTSQDHYATLGLEKNASITEVKKTYRELSKHYHPDMVQNNGKNTQRFMEIAGAYHAIMAAQSDTRTPGPKPWRKKSRGLKTKPRFNQTTFFYTVIPFILALTWISFYASKKYEEQILLSRMETPLPSAAHSGDQVQPVKNPSPLPTTPPVDNPSVQHIPDAGVMDPLPLIPAAEPEEPIASAAKDKIPTQPPSSPFSPDQAPIEKRHLPDTAEPDTQLHPNPVTQPLITGMPEKQILRRIDPVKTDNQVEKDQAVQPLQNSVQDNKSRPVPREQPVPGDQRLLVEGILAEYVKLYNSKDLDHFFALFDEDATENGQLQAQLIDQYRSLFTHTEAIDLHLDDVNWDEHENGFKARSNFTACYTYKDGRIKEHTGNLTFYLTEKQGSLKIQSLDYVFVH